MGPHRNQPWLHWVWNSYSISIPGMMRGPLLSLQARRGARVILDFCIDLGFTLLFCQHTCACSKSLCVPWLFIFVLLSHRYYVKVPFKPDISIYSSRRKRYKIYWCKYKSRRKRGCRLVVWVDCLPRFSKSCCCVQISLEIKWTILGVVKCFGVQLSLVGQTKTRKASSLDAELGHRRNNGSWGRKGEKWCRNRCG